jgi:hypothetical protein
MNTLCLPGRGIISRERAVAAFRHQHAVGKRPNCGVLSGRKAARLVLAAGVLFAAAAARADFTFPDGSSSVSGYYSAAVAADVNNDGVIDSVSEEGSFGPTGSYFGEQFVPNASHAGIPNYGGVAASGMSATPQSIRAYAAVQFPSDHVPLFYNNASSDVAAHESAVIDFSANPDLAGPTFLPLLLTYQLNGTLVVTGQGDNDFAWAGVRFGLVSEGYYDTLDYQSEQSGEGLKLISESLTVRIAAEPTENPLIYLATWDVGQTIYASSAMGTALADFTHTTTLTSLTFGNGQSLEEFGVTVAYSSGGQLAPELTLPDLGGGGTQPVPEPATLTLLCSGGLAMLFPVIVHRRRRAGGAGGSPTGQR